jgi:hypothetical protein
VDLDGCDGQGRQGRQLGIEGGPPSNLFRNGITKGSLPVGTEIKLFGYQAKSGEPKGVGVFVEYLDGRKVFMGGSAQGPTVLGPPQESSALCRFSASSTGWRPRPVASHSTSHSTRTESSPPSMS